MSLAEPASRVVELLVVIVVLGLLAGGHRAHGHRGARPGQRVVCGRRAGRRHALGASSSTGTRRARSRDRRRRLIVRGQRPGRRRGVRLPAGKVGDLRMQQQLPRLCRRVPARRMAGGGRVVGAAGGLVRLLLGKRDVARHRAAHGVRPMPLRGGRGFSLARGGRRRGVAGLHGPGRDRLGEPRSRADRVAALTSSKRGSWSPTPSRTCARRRSCGAVRSRQPAKGVQTWWARSSRTPASR